MKIEKLFFFNYLRVRESKQLDVKKKKEKQKLLKCEYHNLNNGVNIFRSSSKKILSIVLNKREHTYRLELFTK